MTKTQLLKQLRANGIAIPPSELLREHIVAGFLGVHPRTLQRWRDDETGPTATRFGGSWVYSLEAIARYLG